MGAWRTWNLRLYNYIFTRAHDTEAQTIIQRIIRDRINPNLFGYNFTRDRMYKLINVVGMGPIKLMIL